MNTQNPPTDDPFHTFGAQRRLPDVDYSDPSLLFFVTIGTHHRSPYLGVPRLAEEVIASLQWLRTERRLRIHAYCLMADHLHLLMGLPPDSAPLGEVIGRMKTWTTRRSWVLGYQGQLWQNRFYDHVVRSEEEARRIGLYIVHNPVRKGLVMAWEEYRWSGMPDPLE